MRGLAVTTSLRVSLRRRRCQRLGPPSCSRSISSERISSTLSAASESPRASVLLRHDLPVKTFKSRHGLTAARLALGALVVVACSRDAAAHKADDDLEKLQHIVVIYLENHSFDNLYGEFEGANGLANAGGRARQVDRAGKAYTVLPRPPGKAFPGNLRNAPFSIERYVPLGAKTPDLIHRFYQE